ncbi:putative carbonic anhydrase [Sphingomonas changbaiensis NBRC 104936]|uniref:Carbonic anhydrase n=1 Tax=Sphingomonas changbaiensis NBRC 104936 TaxID=1219043 RepID=A0A0E9MNR8_9SPHN|nr:carbonic anhydrase [Sphingomonas changbaiensis]GAO39194.1 putative carbonic anhydrase [Sphingomonas changbaiensis NBRC 104936]
MNELIGRVLDFRRDVFPIRSDLYERLATDGQSPKALMISCADSRVVPEEILRAQPGEVFVCRNAGNIVPPFAQALGGVTSTVEYAVVALGVRDIIVCGHSDCGAMKALINPELLADMPNVAAWLRHSLAARQVLDGGYADLSPQEKHRAAALENVVVQLTHLRTHPSVAAGIARGELTLHGWYFDIHAGEVLALDGDTGHFRPIEHDRPVPVALAAAPRWAASPQAEAAE